jgi:hypothetical protein
MAAGLIVVADSPRGTLGEAVSGAAATAIGESP